MTSTTTTLTTAPRAAANYRQLRLRPETEPGAVRRHAGSLGGVLEHLLLAGLAYLPFLLVKPGVVTSDTKTYLYLDPGRFLRQVASMWNPSVGLGTVNHEYIGYLFPMGPFFWVLSALHVPIWVAQRLWLGTILFAAGAGLLYLARVLNVRGPGRVVAALAYMLSPYFLQYAGRISVILLPWAGLPWMVAFTVLALRKGGWRYPALFALVVASVSGINASSIIYVGVAPVLWLVYATTVEREGGFGKALLTALKIGFLTLVVCLWWIVGLAVEAGYGVNVLKFTETVPSTSATSSAAEVLRGIGYWYFYGQDHLGPWTFSVLLYTQWLWLIALSFFIPVLSFVSAVVVRWRHRAYFVLLVVVGTVLSVGAHPFTHPTPVGKLLKAFMTDTTAGLAMRSTDRATPLIVLGLAMLLGSGVSALWRRLPKTAVLTAVVIGGLIMANNPAMFNGDAEVANGFTQPAVLPTAERQAAAHLNAVHQGTRVLEIPGDDFAAQRWGDTVDPAMAALLTTRPFAIHEQQVMGSEATYDTLFALDEPIQQGTEQWNSLAQMARLISAGDVLVQNDTAYERYGIPQPQLLDPQLQPTPAGLSDPVTYGTPTENVASVPMLNEADLAAPANPAPQPPLVSYTVVDPRPVARAESDQGAVVVAGDATGLENMASAGLLNTDSAIYYAGTLDSHPVQLQQLLANGAALVLTDTNRKQAFRWDTVTANTGYTETATEQPQKTDRSDSPINLFPKAPVGAHTLAGDFGAVSVTASTYGNPVSYTPENRAFAAVDGNPDTSWQTGIFESDPKGEWWQIKLPGPVTENQVTLVQTLNGDTSRWITKAKLTFDGGHPETVTLGPSSRTAAGQVVPFPKQTFSTMRITIEQTNNDTVPTAQASEVGLAEVELPGVHVQEIIVMPTDLLTAAGAASLHNRLTLVMARERVAPYPGRSDPETDIVRAFTLPTARTFTLSGTASLSALIPDSEIDQLLGRPGTDGSGIVAFSSGRLPGGLAEGAGSALDDNPTTIWQPGFEAPYQIGAFVQYDLPHYYTFDHMNLQVVADGRHSVPTSISVSTEQGTRNLTLPPIADGKTPGSVTTIPLSFPALSGYTVKVTITGARFERSSNFYAAQPLALPVAIAEVGLPGLVMPKDPANVAGTCRSDLLSVDGHPVDVRVVGPTATALANGELSVEPCGSSANGITLGPGQHVIETSVGHQTGWQLDQLALDSAPGGGPAPAAPPTALPAAQPGPTPTVTTLSQGPTTLHLGVTGATGPFELVLGESINAGWTAVATPARDAPAGSHTVHLGTPELIDGYANGWSVSAAQLAALGATHTGAFTVTLTWAPQSKVWLALVASAAGVVLCLFLVLVPRRLFRRRRGRHAAGGADDRAADGAETNGHGTAAHGNGTLANGSRGNGATMPVVPALGNGSTDELEVVGWSEEPDRAPELASPLTSDGRRPGIVALVLTALVTGLVATVITEPLVGLAAGVATLAALAIRPARAITSLLAVAFLVAAAVSIVVGQAQHPLPENADWPGAYESAALCAWLAVVFLGADAVATTGRWLAARRRRRKERRRPTPTEVPQAETVATPT